MRFLNLRPQIFENFPELEAHFGIGRFASSAAGSDFPALCQRLRIKPSALALLAQNHSNRVVARSAGLPERKAVPEWCPPADGSWTSARGLFLGVTTADCLPVLFYNPRIAVCGIIHAGWRGTRQEILKTAILDLLKKFSGQAKDFCFYFGPAAQACCYEIGPDLTTNQEFTKFFARRIVRRGGRQYLDFVGANQQQLRAIGVPAAQIENSGICTIHESGYPSHRREKLKQREVLLSLIAQL